MIETKKIETELSSLTKNIRRLVDELSVTAKMVNDKRNLLCLNVHKWIGGQMGLKKFKSLRMACEVLADICKRKTMTIYNWNRYGQSIAEHDFKLDCDHRSIEYFTNLGSYLDRAATLKVIQWIKDKRENSDVMRELKTSKRGIAGDSVRRMRALDKANRLNVTSLKIELMGIQTMARKVLGREDIVIVVSTADMKELVRVGEFSI